MNIPFLLDKLIGFPSVSGQPNKGIINWIETFLQGCGAEINVIPGENGKSCLFARLGQSDCAESGVLFSGHVDVVPAEPTSWSSDPFVARESDGRIYGRGSCDMKGFLACTLMLAWELREKRIVKPIHIAMTYDEELNMAGAKVMADWLKSKSYKTNLVWLGEPTRMDVVVAHKGVCGISTRIKGVSAHSSAPEAGVNAAYLAAAFINWVRMVQKDFSSSPVKDSPFDPPYTTLNVGKICGGVSSNVVPNESEVVWEYRLHPSDNETALWEKYNKYWQEIISSYQKTFPDVSVSESKHIHIPPFETDPSFPEVQRLCLLAGEKTPQTASYGTEASFYQQIGLPTLICGPGNIAQAHKADEYIELNQLNACLDCMREFVRPFMA